MFMLAIAWRLFFNIECDRALIALDICFAIHCPIENEQAAKIRRTANKLDMLHWTPSFLGNPDYLFLGVSILGATSANSTTRYANLDDDCSRSSTVERYSHQEL